MKFLFIALAISSVAFAQAPYKAPRTIDGKPDLQGIWITRNAAAYDVSEVAENHQIPYLPDALEREQKTMERVDPSRIAPCLACRASLTCRFPFRSCSGPAT